MNRQRTDVVVGAALALVLVVGGLLSWQAIQQQRSVERMGMMGSSMTHGTSLLVYVVGTLLVAVVVAGGYVVLRDEFTSPSTDRTIDHEQATEQARAETRATDESDPATAAAGSRPEVLDVLPEDERRILDPIIESPGLTQIELRDRADFSKSKVSQTVSDLEKRGLLYREPQGRTYRVYPDDDLQDGEQ